ncbi:MAG: quinol:cytochrome C oxidoreductase [Bacteroidia bacterium]
MEFTLSNRAKKITFGLMGLGLIVMIIGFFSQKEYLHPEVIDKNTLMVSYHHEVDVLEVDALKQNLKDKAAAHNVEITIEDAHSHAEGEEHHAHHGFEWLIVAKETVSEHESFTEHEHKHTAAQVVEHILHSGEVALKDHHYKRFWSNLMVNGFFFFGISLGALFFLALIYATETGWAVVVKRLFEAVMMALPFGAIILLIVFATGSLHLHHIFHWMDSDLYVEGGEHYDALIAGKAAYLNQPFFWFRTLVYLAVFILFARGFRKRSILEDEVGGTDIHFMNYRKGATFLVLFAVFSTTLAWDWIMSIDTHWFSTLFGWYTFSGIWISGMLTVLFLALYLRRKGLMPNINDSHIHDLGKWVFAVSFLWSYLWFSQFMLIWYSNIPEETTYFITRIEEYRWLFFGVFAVNFILPMLFLMSRESKRAYGVLTTVGAIIFIGHWLDVFLMIMPGTVFGHWTIGLLEIGMFMMFFGAFVFIVLTNLSKAPLMPKHHPYLEESLHHEI